MTLSGKRVLWLATGVIWTLALLLSNLPSHKVLADQITSRSLTLEAGATDGGSKPGGTVNHLFTFTIPNAGSASIGSIKFQYCMGARETVCSSATANPYNLSTAAATLGAQTDARFTNINNTTNGEPYVYNSTPGTFGTNETLKVELDGVVNIASANTSFYVDITTYTSSDATGTPVDEGWVAASTANQITLTGVMPESLVFCTGATVGTTNSLPDCSKATAGNVTFNQLFSPTSTTFATSQMSASTNAQFGYNITVNGSTLKSGINNQITPMNNGGNATTSVPGTSQFGLDLVANDGSAYQGAPIVTGSADIAPTDNVTNYFGQPATNYGTAGSFKFADGDSVANSNSKGTDAQTYTVSYIVNVNGAQPAGTYQTTLTYICTATY